MGFLFGKKPSVTAMAVALENGTPKRSEWSRHQMEEAGKRFQVREKWTAVPVFQIAVHVTPDGGPPFDARMETPLTVVDLIKPGVRVQVKYDPKHPEQVSLVDDVSAFLARNPELAAKPQPANKPATLCAHCGKYYEGAPNFCPNCGQAVSR